MFSFVQKNENKGLATTSFTVTLTPTAGNPLILIMGGGTLGTVNTPTTTGGETVNTIAAGTPHLDKFIGYWVIKNATGGATTFTFSWTTSSTAWGQVLEYNTGGGQILPEVAAFGSGANPGTVRSATFTTHFNNELLMFSSTQTVGSETETPFAGYTERANDSSGTGHLWTVDNGAASYINTAGSQTPGGTATGNVDWSGLGVGFTVLSSGSRMQGGKGA